MRGTGRKRHLIEREGSYLNDRMKKLKNLFASKELDGYLVFNEKNLKYFTDFSGGSVLLVPQEGENILLVYGVNYEAAGEEAKNAAVELIKPGEDFAKKVAGEMKGLKLRRIGFDSLKASSYLRLKELLEVAELEAAGEVVWSLRKVKDEAEISLIKKAAGLTSRGMKKAFEIMGVGLREREVAAEVEYEMRRSGSDGVAFDTIVSSGPSSAFPHGGCGDRKIGRGDFVVVDLGAKYRGYCADLTRTFIIGKPSPRQVEIYETIMKAHSLGVGEVRAGVEAKEVDRVAREYIVKKGHGEYFVHSLGHGVGLDVHELPVLSPTSEDILASGNIVTVEPGIYVPKFGGARIEDTVLVLDGEAKKLTDAPVALGL